MVRVHRAIREFPPYIVRKSITDINVNPMPSFVLITDLIHTSVFMILTGQVGLYFWKTSIHSRDALWIKGIVGYMWRLRVSMLTCYGYRSYLSGQFSGASGQGLTDENRMMQALEM